MQGPKTIVQALEAHVPEFYTQVGQYLRPWVPSAPKVAAQQEKETKLDARSEAAAPKSGGINKEDTGTGEHQYYPDDT